MLPDQYGLLELGDSGAIDNVGTLASKMKLGTMCTGFKIVGTAITAASAIQLSTLRNGVDGIVVTTLDGSTTPSRYVPPKAGTIRTLRVTASGTAGSVGAYGVTDASGTAIVPPGGASAALGIARLSDDGDTITLPNSVTGFVLTYYPRPAADGGAQWPPIPPG